MVFRDISDTMALTSKMRHPAQHDFPKNLPCAAVPLHYQPKVDVQTDRITGVEALLRREHLEWGPVMPGRFITIAEDSNLSYLNQFPIDMLLKNHKCSES